MHVVVLPCKMFVHKNRLALELS